MNIMQKVIQRRGIYFLSVCVFFVTTQQIVAYADEPTAETQQRVDAIGQQLRSATVRIRSGSDVCSGVVVSENGLVLTVAHGLKANAATMVMLPRQEMYEAKQLVVDASADIALLSIKLATSDAATNRFIPLSIDDSSKVGDIVMAAGFPARELDGQSVVIRLGEILASDNSAIKTSCTLTSGDSGGPLVNSRGELIGINRQIGTSPDSNGHIALAVIRSVLKNTEFWNSLPQQIRDEPAVDFESSSFLPGPAVVRAARESTVEISGTDSQGNAAVRTCGTILDTLHIATKLSEIADCTALECRFADDSKINATLSKFDRTSDLAILTLDAPRKFSGVARALKSGSRTADSLVDRIVFSAISPTEISAAGIISRADQQEPGLPARFGATMQADSGHLRITELSPNGSVVTAGLKVRDEILRFDGSDEHSLTAVGDLLESYQPGDWIALDIKRGDKEFRVNAQLQHDPSQQFEKTEFLDGRAGQLSQRRSNLHALQHDIAITPKACGGPLLDMHGHIIGINIARRARESTLAIPIEEVLKTKNISK